MLLTNTIGLTVWVDGQEGDVALVELCALKPTAAEVAAARSVIEDQHQSTLDERDRRFPRVGDEVASLRYWDSQTRKSAVRRDRMLAVLTRYEGVVGHWERYGHL